MNERTGFSARLRRRANDVWEAQHEHPFVRGIADGSLDLDRFRFWVRQDYLFLIDYARLMALGAARAPDLNAMGRFADLVQGILRTEMDLHRSYAAEFGIGLTDLEHEVRSPTTQGYTDFLLRSAATGDYADLLAALLPCMWGFAEIGQRLEQGARPADPRYAAWIDMYASPEMEDLAAWCRDAMDRAADGLPERSLVRLEDIFLTSSRYELAFWGMAWQQEQWPV